MQWTLGCMYFFTLWLSPGMPRTNISSVVYFWFKITQIKYPEIWDYPVNQMYFPCKKLNSTICLYVVCFFEYKHILCVLNSVQSMPAGHDSYIPAWFTRMRPGSWGFYIQKLNLGLFWGYIAYVNSHMFNLVRPCFIYKYPDIYGKAVSWNWCFLVIFCFSILGILRLN